MKYLIGTLCGGLMECPEFSFSGPYDIVSADSRTDACKLYNKKHNCDYFYGSVMATIADDGSYTMVSKYCTMAQIEDAIREASHTTSTDVFACGNGPCKLYDENKNVQYRRINGYLSGHRIVDARKVKKEGV